MKKQTLLALPCVLSCLALNADHHDSSDGLQNNNQEAFKSAYERIEMQEITPNAGPVVKGGVDAYVEADYILWHVNEGGLAYELEDNHRVAPRFQTSSGFKVGSGLHFAYDGWDMASTYTWLHSYASRTFFNHSLRTDWKLHFNVVDLELGRNFFVSPKLTLRPHFGLKGTWQTQKFDKKNAARWSVFVSEEETKYFKGEILSVASQDYWGLGIRTGLDASWMVARCFNVFGQWAFSTVWGQFTNQGSMSSVVIYADSDIDNAHSNDGFNISRTHQLNGVFEMQLGLCYDCWLSDDNYRLRVSVAWENQLWFNQNHLYQSKGELFNNQLLVHSNSPLKGDLSFQGLTLNFRFDF